MKLPLRRSMIALVTLALSLVAAPTLATSVAIPIPGVRVTGGLLWQLTDEKVYGALDVLPNIEVVDSDSGVAFTFLLGYGYEGGGNHLFQVGLDVGAYDDVMVSGSLGLRGVLGSVDDDLGGGFRVVAGGGFWFGVLRVEASYQLLSRHDGVAHDLRISAGVDVIRLMVAPFILMFD